MRGLVNLVRGVAVLRGLLDGVVEQSVPGGGAFEIGVDPGGQFEGVGAKRVVVGASAGRPLGIGTVCASSIDRHARLLRDPLRDCR